MALKSIFVPFRDEKSAEKGFRAAALLAKGDKAHISVAHMRARPAPPTDVYFPLGGMSTEFTENFQKTEDQLAENLKSLFTRLCDELNAGVVNIEERTDAHGVTASWADVEGDLITDYAHLATASDLSVFCVCGDDATAVEEDIAESLVFLSGRPVLICPAAGLASAPKKIAIAWNGSQEAARAVGASLDILRDAEKVTVISVRKVNAPLINTDEITAYLRLHDIAAARSKIEAQGDESEAARLDKEILQEQPDLLVMGAYSHSRWRQAVLGGFTRHIIHEAKMPVLMMH